MVPMFAGTEIDFAKQRSTCLSKTIQPDCIFPKFTLPRIAITYTVCLTAFDKHLGLEESSHLAFSENSWPMGDEELANITSVEGAAPGVGGYLSACRIPRRGKLPWPPNLEQLWAALCTGRAKPGYP